MRSGGYLPFISPLLYRRSVQRVARRAAAGDVPAVRELAAALCTTADAGARTIAGSALRSLVSPEQARAFCRETILQDNPLLLALAQECRYLPAPPAERALYGFCTAGPPDPLPAEYLPLLAAGYAGASAPIRARARSAARTNGTCSILARALAGRNVTRHAGSWTYDEWDIVITGLVSGQQWDDLWLLATLAPIPLAVTAIGALKGAGWVPAGDDLFIWNSIVSALPVRWMHLVPAGHAPVPDRKPSGKVISLCFSQDGSLFATGCQDGLITVRRTASAGPAAEFSTGPAPVRFLAFSADNTRLVTGGDDGTVHGYGLQERSRIWSFEGCGGTPVCSPSPCSRSVLVGDPGGSLHVLDAANGQNLHSHSLHPSPVTCISHAPGGSPVACGHADGTVSVIGCVENCTPRLFSGTGSPVCSLTFSPAGTELLVLCEQADPVLLDIAAGTSIRQFAGPAGRAVCHAVSAEGGWFVIGSDDQRLRCWSWREPVPAAILPFPRRHITCCSPVAGGSLLAIGFQNGRVRICRMPGGEFIRECGRDKKPVTACALSPDGTRLAAVNWDGTAWLWRLPEGEVLRTLDAHAGGIAALAGPAGSLIAMATGDGVARIFDGSDGTLLRVIDLYTPSVRAAAMSHDGTYLASAGADGSLRIWALRDGSLAAAADTPATSQRCCTFFPDGASLVTGGWDGTCRIYRVPDAHLLRTLAGHTSVVTCCAVSRDGSLLVTGSNDTTVRLWNTEEEEAYAVLGESCAEVSAVALSPDETVLAAGSADGRVRLWQLPYGMPATDLPGLPWKVTALAFTPDGCTLIAGSERGTCALFSLPEKTLLRFIPCHTGAVTGIAVLPGGRTLVTTGGDGVCRFHSLPPVPFLVDAALADIPAAAREEELAGSGAGNSQWAFLRTMLSARFRHHIEISPASRTAGCHDIQIVG
jgi:WD40 repeat protein